MGRRRPSSLVTPRLPLTMHTDSEKHSEGAPPGSYKSRFALLVCSCFAWLPVAEVCCWIWLALRPSTCWLPLVLCLWVYWDRHTPCRGSRSWPRLTLRGSAFMRHVRLYQDVRIFRLPGSQAHPGKKYIVDAHPHGLCVAHQLSMLLTDLGAEVHGPLKIMTLHVLFYLPVYREILMMADCISNREDSMRHVLSSASATTSAAVVASTGGGLEARRLRPGEQHYYCKRKGICRIALLEGAAIVPILCVGESNTYRQPFIRFQNYVYSKTGWSFAIPLGRGLFQKYIGVMPDIVPYDLVAGEPLEVEQTSNPSREQIDEVHRRHIEAIRKLYSDFSASQNRFVGPLEIDS